ncbi:MAG TPA: hypothetical protein VFS84_11435 [Candidatus Binatia bacterium]|nr:hypothetical protein [Candidatus Binatia bacterium]
MSRGDLLFWSGDRPTAKLLGSCRFCGRIRPVFGSDFTHFDVPDFKQVMPKAFELIEKGFVTEQDFREFTFTNAARLYTRYNMDFFKGTLVEHGDRGAGTEDAGCPSERSGLPKSLVDLT